MRKSINRRGLKLRDMSCSGANDVGPAFTVNRSSTLSDQDTDVGPESDGPHVTDQDNVWESGDGVARKVERIQSSIDNEVQAHAARDERTKWSVDNSGTAETGGARMSTAKARREHRRIMTALRRL